MCVRMADRLEEGIRNSGTRVKDSFELPDVGLENQIAHCVLAH